MTDREKVIRELETLGAWHTHHYAPFHYEAAETIHDAIALLREQEAVKPQLSISGMWYECPICHRHLTKDRDNYCARCGRAVKWDY